MEWKEVRLGDIADVQTGPFGSQLHKSDYIAEGIPCIMPTNIGPHLNLVVDGIAHVSEVDANRLSRHLTEFGDIIYARRGDIEKCAYVTTNEEKWLCGTGCLKIRCKNEVNSRFIAYLLSTAECKKWITGNAVGTTMLNLSKGILSNLPLIIPSLVDQRRIASILSSLDRKIELNNKINADLEEMAQAIFKNWFVDFEPFKDGKFVDSELGMIPEGWKVGTLDEIFSLKYGKNLSTSMILEKGDYPVYGANGIIGYYNEFNCDKYSVLVTSRGNGSGDVSRTHHPKSFITNNSFVVEPLEHYKYIKLPFINGLFNIIDFKSYCSGSAQPQLTNKAMRNICIISPPRELVIKYCEILEPLFSHIECVIDENSRLTLLRDTLLPRLMSGELEVPE